MIGYRINASIRNKAGREIAHRTPLWHGEASDAKQALAYTHPTVDALIRATPDADTLVLTVIGTDGSRVTATEYAEDFLIAPGASLGKTGLLDPGDHGFTQDQLDAAQRALETRALDAMPGIARKVADKAIGDAVKDFFGGKLPSESNKPKGYATKEEVFKAVDDDLAGRLPSKSGLSCGEPLDEIESADVIYGKRWRELHAVMRDRDGFVIQHPLEAEIKGKILPRESVDKYSFPICIDGMPANKAADKPTFQSGGLVHIHFPPSFWDKYFPENIK